MPSLGPFELGIILLLVLVLFGAGWISGTIEALGKSVRQFRADVREEDPPAEGGSGKNSP